MKASALVSGLVLVSSLGLVHGVSFAKTHPSNPTANCSHQYNDQIRAESHLHVANVHACGSNTACKHAEAIRHEQAVKRIQAGRKLCQGQ